MRLPSSFITLLYNAVFLPLAEAAFFVGSFINNKLALRVRGIATSWDTLRTLPKATGSRVWFHAASMGEFEQAKSVIESLKEQCPEAQIVVSFFSPSGYENQKHYSFADAVVYLPLDSRRTMRRFVSLMKPDTAVFVRYDIWPNVLAELQKQHIPALLICATLNPDSFLLSATLAAFTRRAYEFFTKIYTSGIDETERFIAHKLVAPEVLITAADTRFDRIMAQVQRAADNPVLPPSLFAPGNIVLVAGSTWEPDEDILLQAYDRLSEPHRSKLRLILVPHEPNENTVTRLLARLPGSERLSVIETAVLRNSQPEFTHIIVDSIGKLLRLYGHAQGAYIGGGFGVGVHSVTEPAGYGVPLACGPAISKARDAIALHDRGALSVVHTADDATEWLTSLLSSPSIREKHGLVAREYLHTATGYSATIARDILRYTETTTI